MIIYFDENIPKHLVEGFALIQKFESIKSGIKAQVKYIPTEFHRGVKDIDWIPQLTANNSFVITQDINITRRKQELELYKNHKIGLFLLRGKTKKQGMSVWEMVETLAKHWPFVLERISSQNPPFAYEVKLQGKPKKLQ